MRRPPFWSNTWRGSLFGAKKRSNEAVEDTRPGAFQRFAPAVAEPVKTARRRGILMRGKGEVPWRVLWIGR